MGINYTDPAATGTRSRPHIPSVPSILEEQLAASRCEVDNLKIALESARVIGAAVGIVMALEKVSYEDAFAKLVYASQHQNRKVRYVADEVVQYGVILSREAAPSVQLAS